MRRFLRAQGDEANPEAPPPEGAPQEGARRRFPWVVGGTVLLLVLGALVGGYWFLTSGYKRVASSRLERAVGVPSEVGGLTLGLEEGDLTLTLTDVYLYQPGSQEKALVAPKVHIQLDPVGLVRGRLDVQQATFQSPIIRLFRDPSGRIGLLGSPLSYLFKRPEEAKKGWRIGPFSLERVKDLAIRQGRIELIDRFPPRHPPSPIAALADLTIEGLSSVSPWSFRGEGQILAAFLEGPPPTFRAEGRIRPAPSPSTQIELTLKEFRPRLVQELFPDVQALQRVRGRVNLTLNYTGRSSQEFQSSGKVTLRSLTLRDPRIARGPIHLSGLLLAYESQRRGDRLSAQASLEGRGLIGEGSFRLRGFSGESRWLEAALSFPSFSLEQGKRYLPWEALPPGLVRFLEEDLSGGHILSLEIQGAGRPERLAQVGSAIRTGRLSARLRFADLTYRFSPHLPLAADLKGLALLEEGKLSLRDLQGRSEGLQLLKGNGVLVLYADRLPLDLDLKARGDLGGYLSSIDTDSLPPRLAFVRRLRGVEGQGELSLRLSGPLKGSYPQQFQGRVALSGGALPQGLLPLPLSQLQGTIAFDPQVLQTSSLQGVAGSSTFSLRATLRDYRQPQPGIDLDLQASAAAQDLNRLLPAGLLPGLASAQPLPLQLSLQGTPAELKIRQELDLTAASYQTPGGRKPSHLSNHVLLEGLWEREGKTQRLEIQTLVFSLPPSEIRGTGRILFEPRPYLQLALQIPRLGLPRLAQLAYGAEGWNGDAHLHGALRLDGSWKEPGALQVVGQLELQGEALSLPQLTLPLEQLQASLRFDRERFSLDSGRVRVNGSSFTLTGEFLRAPQPQAHFQLSGGELNLDRLLGRDLLRKGFPPEGSQEAWRRSEGRDLIRLLSGQLEKNPIFRATWKGQIDLDTLVFRGVPFQELHLAGSAGRGQVELTDLAFEQDSGEVRLKAFFGSPLRGLPRLIFAFQATDLDTQVALKQLGRERADLLSGSLSLEGTLIGEGRTEAQVLRSLDGEVALEIQEGRIYRFSWLSRIFSLMNLYQLVQGRLPDLVSEGLPFDTIQGNFTVKDGVAHTKDFLLQGPAVNMSAVGNIYLHKGTLKIIVGVQPLQTFARVVGLVPFASYLLLGKEKKLLVAYFRVKGKIEDPSVAPRPVQTLSRGILGILERTLRFPLEFPQQIPILGQESFWERVYQCWKRFYQWIKFW